MALQVSGQVSRGGLPAAAAGSNPPVSQGQFGEAMVTEINARYYNLVNAGLVFGSVYPAAATIAASSTIMGAFALYNPPGSGKNLVLLDCSVAVSTIAASTTYYAVGLAGNPSLPTTPTAITLGNTPANLNFGSAVASVAKTVVAGTTAGATTTIARLVGSFYYDLVAGDSINSIKDQIDGAIIVGPGGYVSLYSISGTPTIVAGFTWAEITV